MDLWTNLGLAWISMIITLLLLIIYFLRILSKRKTKLGNAIKNINRKLRKNHKYLGILLVLTGLIHGLFSTTKVFTFNLGTIGWIVSILLGLNWMARKYTKRFKGWIYYHRLLSVLFVGLVIWHIIDVGGIQIHKLIYEEITIAREKSVETETYIVNKNDSTLITEANLVTSTDLAQIQEETEGLQFNDGTYTGEATGYRDGLIVSVVIENNQILSVEVIDHNEVSSRFYSTPVALIPEEIVAAQSTEVDTISGATFTSTGIINAVNNALSQALISGEIWPDKELPTSSHGRH